MSDGEDGSSTRNKPVTMYYSADEKAAIKHEAQQAGKTVSTYCRDLIERQRRADDLEELDAEARLERVMARGTDHIEEIAEDIREQNGLVIYLLREIEGQLEAVDVEELNAADEDGQDDRGDSTDENDKKGVDDLL